MKVLVCGGRDYARVTLITDDQAAYEEAKAKATAEIRRLGTYLECLKREGMHTIIHGDAPGADTAAGRWAERNGVMVFAYPADWNRHQKAAGPIRNQLMLDHERPDLVVAFPGGRGTADMVARSKAQGFEVREAV